MCRIQRTFPIRELPATEECSHVEMDPEDKSSTMWEAANAGLKIVGWYHSHPTFSRSPTTIDVYNQVLEQHAQRETEAEGAASIYEPYVGAIICPFDVKEKKATSEIMWYYVEHAAGIVPSDGQRPEEVGCLARSFVPEPISNPLYGLENLASMQRELENLSKRYAQYKYRTELEAWWTGDVSVAEKLVKSLLSRLPPALGESKISKFAEKVLFSTRAVWNIYGASMSHMVKDSMTSPQIDPDAKSDILCVTSVRRSGDDAGTAQNVGDRVGEPISEEDEETEEE